MRPASRLLLFCGITVSVLIGLEVQYRFRTELDLLALLGCGNARAGAGAAGCSDRRTFTSANQSAKNRAGGRSDADLGCRVLALAFTLA